MNFFPGYGPLGPAFWRDRSLIPGVVPVAPPALPGLPAGAGAPAGPGPAGFGVIAGGGGPARPMVATPVGGNPLAALAHTPLGPVLADLLARAPQVGAHLAGHAAGGFPPEVPGMPQMPAPPPELFGGPGSGLGAPTRPVEVPQWFVEQQARRQG